MNQFKLRSGTARVVAVVLLIASSFATVFETSASASASACPAGAIDLSTADAADVALLSGQTLRSAKKLVRLRDRGDIVNALDLRILKINDRRFLKLATDERACFEGVLVSELLPSNSCKSDEARINSGSLKSLAERIGWKNARPLVNERPIRDIGQIEEIPDRGSKILGRLARKGGTCLDPAGSTVDYFGEGRVLIGQAGIRPGVFAATPTSGCSWARFNPAASSSSGAIARTSQVEAEQVVVAIDASDTSFISVGCGVWRRVSAYPMPMLDSIPGDGDWIVSGQIMPGTYRASDVDDCSWTRKSSHGGTASDVIESAELVDQHVLVSIVASDTAFTSAGCGSWVPVAAECMSQLDAVFPAQPEVAPHIYGISNSVLLSTQYEIGLAFTEFTVNWGGFGGLNAPNAPTIVDIEIGEGKVTGSTVIVGLGHNYRGSMRDDYAGYIDAVIEVFPDHVDRVIWVTPSRFNTDMPYVVEQLNAAAERWPQLEIADFWVEGDAQNHPEWYNDEIHLDVEGRLVMADYLLDKLVNPCG